MFGLKKEWFTWANAKRFYLALAGAVIIIGANWTDAPSWVTSTVSAITAGAVWIVKQDEPSTSGR